MLQKNLVQLGLTEKEAKVYLALLELGQESVQHIAQKSEINRATTYFILDSLMKQGLASKVEKDKTTFFSPEPPQQLINILKKQEAEIKQKVENFKTMLPELHGVYNLAENKPVVRFFEGKEGLKTIQEDFLKTNDKQIESISSLDDVERVFSNSEKEEYGRKRREKKILAKCIYVSKGEAINDDDYSVRFRVPEEKFPLTADITLYDNKVAIASLRGNLSGVIIENAEIAKTLRSVFKLAFAKAKDLQD